MMQKASFSEPQPAYRYFPIDENRADVIVHSYIETVTDEEGYASYLYHINCFSVNPADITEDMVRNNPMGYLDYNPEKEKEQTDRLAALEEQNAMLMECLLEMSAVVYG